MAQLEDAPVDYQRMLRTAKAHLEVAKTAAESDWERQYLDNTIFCCEKLLERRADQ